MSDGNSSGSAGGIGFATLLFLVFLVLKLTHVITWSWWWVTSPLWISAISGILLFICILIIAIVMKSIDK
jgi:hypothetical protein